MRSLKSCPGSIMQLCLWLTVSQSISPFTAVSLLSRSALNLGESGHMLPSRTLTGKQQFDYFPFCILLVTEMLYIPGDQQSASQSQTKTATKMQRVIIFQGRRNPDCGVYIWITEKCLSLHIFHQSLIVAY